MCSGIHMRYTCTPLLAAALCHLLGSAGESRPAKPPECQALKYLTRPQGPVSIVATHVLDTDKVSITYDLEFDYDGQNVRAMQSERGSNRTFAVCIHEGRKYRYNMRGDRATLAEVNESATLGVKLPTLENAAGTAMSVNSLGLGFLMPGEFELDGTTIRLKDPSRHDVFSVTGTATVDDAGLLRQLVITAVMRRGLPGAVSTVTYEYGGSPDIAPGFPAGWTCIRRAGDRVHDQMTVTIHKWSNTPPSPDKFAPSSWAPQVDMYVQPTPPALKPGVGPLQ